MANDEVMASFQSPPVTACWLFLEHAVDDSSSSRMTPPGRALFIPSINRMIAFISAQRIEILSIPEIFLNMRRRVPAFDLVFYPDPRFSTVAAPVMVFDDDLAERAVGLLGTLQKAAAIGLAGPHVGLMERLVVLQMEPGLAPRIYVNPIVTWASEERAVHEEGSVSMPGIREDVERAANIRLVYRDLKGDEHEETAEGFEAACLQHEIDQLDGIFWIERLSRLRRERVRKRFIKLRRQVT